MNIFNEQLVSVYPILIENQSLCVYNGQGSQQNVEAFKVFANLLINVKPKRILEIGTGMGGLTHYLKTSSDKLNLNLDILSFDTNSRHNYNDLIEMGVDLRVENVFNADYSELLNTEVIDFIKDEGVTIALCDGGYKIGEFNLLSKYLKVGDIIMAHDYAKNKEYFNEEINGKFWNWHEIQDSDIEESVEKYNLKPYMQDEFDKAVWVCKIKADVL